MARPGLVAGPDPISNPFWRYDADLGWAHAPGEEGAFSRDEFSHGVRINSMGFRDVERDPAAEPPPGERRPFRIAVFGDSFTWGHGVEDDAIFTRLLEAMLPGVEVWNFGVSAYSTDQELLLFRRVAPRVRPDVVLVMLSRNDFEGNLSSASGAYPKPRFVFAASTQASASAEEGAALEAGTAAGGGRLVLTNVPVPKVSIWSRTGSWLRRRSALANGLATLVSSDSTGGSRPTFEEERAMTLALLDAFTTETAQVGVRLAVALVPSTAHVYPETIPRLELERFDAVRRWGAARDVPVLDLIPSFRAAFAATGRMYHYRADKHWTEGGHRLVAETLARLLVENGLVSRP